jgi:hypothetical protein
MSNPNHDSHTGEFTSGSSGADAPARPAVVPHAGAASVGTHTGGKAHGRRAMGGLLALLLGGTLGVAGAVARKTLRDMKRGGRH